MHAEKEGIAIAICGESGAGKTTTTEVLKDLGFVSYSVSSMVREEALQEFGNDASREQVQGYAKKKQEEAGGDYFARKFIQSANPFEHQMVVLDGVRNLEELAILKQAAKKAGSNLILLGMIAHDSTRFHRVQGRGRAGDPNTIESFKAADARAAGSDTFQQNQVLIEHADVQLVNDGSLEDLQNAVASVVHDIVSKQSQLA